MAYDDRTAARIRAILSGRRGVTERAMFGGLAFMVNEHMCVGVLGKDLVLKLGNIEAAKALTRPHVRPMDFTGRVLKSFVYVNPKGYATDAALARWIALALEAPASASKRRAKKSGKKKRDSARGRG